MTKKELKIAFEEYTSIDEMQSEDRELVLAAIDAASGSYAPYSHFNVGAAVRLDDGTIVKGSNQENNAYPSGLCAERTAMFSASANYPDRHMVSIALCGGPDGTVTEVPASPCGACRQVMAEFQRKGGEAMSIILHGSGCTRKFPEVDSLLPFIFDAL